MNTNSLLTSEAWLRNAESRLRSAAVPNPRLDCLVLLQDVLQRDKSHILAHPEYILPSRMLELLNKQISRRANHEPLAYIRGKSEFYGREFIVSADTLQPRPETETMIDLVKELVKKSQKSFLLQSGPVTDDGNVRWIIVDVGTGSGCLAITAKLEFPEAEIIATDINPACLKIARQNAKNLDVDIKFYQGDLLQALPSTTYHLPLIILANLPYVPDSHTINRAAMHEPPTAIFGGADGLKLYRNMFEQIGMLIQKPHYVLTESLPFQHEDLAKIALRSGYQQSDNEDFIQVFMATDF